MWLQFCQQWKERSTPSLFLKCGATLIFLLFSVLIVACGSNSSGQVDPDNPIVTVTIRIGQFNGSPTPPSAPYYCGAWATNTSPAFNVNSIINVYAKFTRNVNGNPVGVDAATATATILWPDGTTTTESVTTKADGLAVFAVALKSVALNKIVLVNVTFTKPGFASCTVPQAAYFTAMLGGSPITKGTGVPLATSTANPPPNTTPSSSPTPGGTTTPIPSPTRLPPSPTPKPTKTPHPHR